MHLASLIPPFVYKFMDLKISFQKIEFLAVVDQAILNENTRYG